MIVVCFVLFSLDVSVNCACVFGVCFQVVAWGVWASDYEFGLALLLVCFVLFYFGFACLVLFLGFCCCFRFGVAGFWFSFLVCSVGFGLALCSLGLLVYGFCYLSC